MAKKKTGSIAVPYLVTIFLGILIIGGGTFFLLRHLGILDNEKQLPEPTPRQITTTTYADNHTILFILDEPDEKCPSTFMLMRSIPKDKRIVFLGIPTNTISVIDGSQQNIKTAYETGGTSGAVNFVEQLFGIDVDRYMKFDSTAFIKACDILGGVTYPISEDIAIFNGDGSEVYLNAEQIDKYITYAAFKGGEVERAYNASSIISAMVNQASGVRIADNLDNSFNTIINMVDSDITAVDYKDRKTAIKTMFERGKSMATFYIVDGETAYNDFIPSSTFINDFVETYYSYDESVSDSSEGESDGE
ncbi:MAG: LCP family protein [Ruminococcus flavefaciens]|nr:LCP family protein [Ruminococcus flavefaciens]MCM1230433.1 LCP family protein [Ruminococcus flavefaciens]